MFNMCHIYRPPEWVTFPLTHFNKFPAESMILFWQIRLLHVKKNCFYESEFIVGQFDRTFCNIWPVLLHISAPIFVFLLFVASGYICACFSTLSWNFWKTWFYRDAHIYVFSELNFKFLTYSEVISVCALVETVIKQLTFRLVEVTLCSTGPRLPPVCDSQRSQSGSPPWRLCAGRPIQEKRQK